MTNQIPALQQKIRLVLGIVCLIVLLPVIGVVVGSSVLWNFVMKKTMKSYTNNYWLSKKPAWLHKFNLQFVRHEEDAYTLNVIYAFAFVMPVIFLLNLWYVRTYGFSVLFAYLYNLVRIGPYFMNFAYVYTLCHKEGHYRQGMYKTPGALGVALRNVFNWWIGLFFGVLPSNFSYGHSMNHHKYDGLEGDVVTTSDAPRDSFLHYCAFLPRFLLYSFNISPVIQFASEGLWKYTFRMILGNVAYSIFLYLCWTASPSFTLAFVVYPFMEQCLLLASIAWCWHAFIDPDNIYNEYAASITIFDGEINVLQENFHVVHHQYPNRHWTEHPALFEKHKEEYTQQGATMFRGTHVFELFFLMLLKDYKRMAELFVDPSGKLSMQDKMDLLKKRLHVCTWGPLATPEVLKQTEQGNVYYMKNQKRGL